MRTVIEWGSKKSVVLKSPILPEVPAQNELLELLPGHVWISTSGTTNSKRKWVGISQAALLASAAAVNEHLSATNKDIWLNPLPLFHVGGIGILARAYLSGGLVEIMGGWSVAEFMAAREKTKATLTSLVPTQVFDLVDRGARAPASLRAVIVGGGALNEGLYKKAKSLGWPLLPSYGLSECSSQVATAPLLSLNSDDARLEILKHVEVRIADDGFLEIKSPALFTAYAEYGDRGWDLVDPKRDGWFKTEDLAKIEGAFLKPLGRINDQVKILGELVNVAALNETLDCLRIGDDIYGEAALLPRPDSRAGTRLDLVTGRMNCAQALRLKNIFDGSVAPFERSANLYCVSELPRNDLGKLERARLLEFLGL